MAEKKNKKPTRHSKITGDLGEYLVLYLLSKNHFETVHVDHTGIDLIAVHPNPKIKKFLGISVKSTGTFKGKYIYHENKQLDFACKKFNCIPYYAIVSDVEQKLCVCILERDVLFKLCPKRAKKGKRGKKGIYHDFKMTNNALEEYKKNQKIGVIEFEHRSQNLYTI